MVLYKHQVVLTVILCDCVRFMYGTISIIMMIMGKMVMVHAGIGIKTLCKEAVEL